MIRQAAQPMSARDVCRILFRHRWRSALFFVAVVGLAIGGVLLMPRKYRSEAKLFVKVNYRVDPAATTDGQVLTMGPEREGEMRSVVALLHSRSLFEYVVDELGVDIVFEHDLAQGPLDHAIAAVMSLVPRPGGNDSKIEREKAIRHLMEAIDIEHPNKSHVVTLAYESRSPERARQILSTYIQAALVQHVEVNQNPDTFHFFAEQEALLAGKVLAAKQQLRDAKNQLGLVSVAGQRKVLEDHVTSLDSHVLNSEADLASSEDRIELLRRNVPFEMQQPTTASSLSTRSIDEMRNQLFTLEIRYRDLLARFAPRHPQVIAVGEQLEQARVVLDQQQLLIEMSTAAALRSKLESLRRDYDTTRQRLQDLNGAEVRIAELERKVEDATSSHAICAKKLEQARLDQQLESGSISNLRLAGAPTLMGKPLSRHGALIASLAVLVALAGAVGVAYASELLDESLATPADIESDLGIPVLMSLPRTRSPRISLN